MPQGLLIRLLNAATATNGAPSASTDGVAVPPAYLHRKDGLVRINARCSLTSGTATFDLILWGYNTHLVDTTLTKVASSDAWTQIYAPPQISITADGNEDFIVDNANAYTRFYLELDAVTGTGATITGSIGLE